MTLSIGQHPVLLYAYLRFDFKLGHDCLYDRKENYVKRIEPEAKMLTLFRLSYLLILWCTLRIQ